MRTAFVLTVMHRRVFEPVCVNYSADTPEDNVQAFPVAVALDPELLKEDIDRQRSFPTYLGHRVQPVPLLGEEGAV